MDEVEVLSVDLGGEVRNGVDARFLGPPVKAGGPRVHGIAKIGVRGTGVPVVNWCCLGQAGPCESLQQVVELGLGNVQVKVADINSRVCVVLHVFDDTVDIGTFSS